MSVNEPDRNRMTPDRLPVGARRDGRPGSRRGTCRPVASTHAFESAPWSALSLQRAKAPVGLRQLGFDLVNFAFELVDLCAQGVDLGSQDLD